MISYGLFRRKNELTTEQKTLADQVQGLLNSLDKPAFIAVPENLVYEFRAKKIEPDIFRCLAGIRSIVGNNNYCLTDKPTIFGRMLGAKNKQEFEKLKHRPEFRSVIDNYCKSIEPLLLKRYPMDKLLKSLVTRKFIQYLSIKNHSKFYVSGRFYEFGEFEKHIRQVNNKRQVNKQNNSRRTAGEQQVNTILYN